MSNFKSTGESSFNSTLTPNESTAAYKGYNDNQIKITETGLVFKQQAKPSYSKNLVSLDLEQEYLELEVAKIIAEQNNQQANQPTISKIEELRKKLSSENTGLGLNETLNELEDFFGNSNP